MASTLDNLLKKKWAFEQLNTIFDNLKSDNPIERASKEQNLVLVLDILDQYKLSEKSYDKILFALNHPP